MHKHFWKNRTVLVTGGSGLLGGWLVSALLREQAEVVVLLRDELPNCMLVREDFLRQVTVVRGSLAELALLKRTIAEYQPETIFHLAAQTLVGVAKIDPVGTLEANVQGTWNLLEATRLSRVGQIVIASSDKAYGESDNLPYREDHPLHGRYPYDVSKSCADLICQMYAATYQVRAGISRCGNLFGGGDLNFSRTVPGVIRATLAGERFVIRSDGKFVRDFLYVEDAVDAYMLLAEHLAKDPSLAGRAFNFSIETRLTVLELVEKLLSLLGRTDLRPVIQNDTSNEIREQYMLATSARERLGWTPKYGMEQGLLKTIAWYRDLFLTKRTPELAFQAVSGNLR